MNRDQIFFGGITETESSLALKFTHLQFHRVKQVHGDKLIETCEATAINFKNFQKESVIIEGDALWSTKQNHALVVATADCLPVIIRHPDFICAIHAGWRGVINEIIPKSISSILNQLGLKNLSHAKAHIGPHIRAKSFEVGMELKDSFLQVSNKYFCRAVDTILVHPTAPKDKVRVDLSKIALGQLHSTGFATDSIELSEIDTFSDTNYHSYRRGRGICGRNLSFVSRPQK